MHEFSIAVNIVEIASENAKNENASVVKEVEVEVGELSGVVIDALEFCMEAAAKESILEGARINLIHVAGRGRCRTCSHEFGIVDLYSVCPKCNSPAPEIVRGKELRVKSLVVD